CSAMLGPELVASETTEGWMLMRDHGLPIADVLSSERQIEVLVSLLPEYAHVQAATAARTTEWIDLGMPDRSVRLLPALFDQFAAGEGCPDPAACVARLPLLTEACAVLEAAIEPDALDHADLHGWNV